MQTTPVRPPCGADTIDGIETRPEGPTPMEVDDLLSPRARLGMMDMPAEILLAIGQQLVALSTYALVSWATITGITVPDCLLCASVDASVRRIAMGLAIQSARFNKRRLLDAHSDTCQGIIVGGAPLPVVKHLLRATAETTETTTAPAVCPKDVINITAGGRVDVLSWALSNMNVSSDIWYGKDRWIRDDSRHAANAMLSASRRDRRAALCWLLERAIADHVGPFTTPIHEEIILYGLKRGYDDVVDAVHRLQRDTAYRQQCWCPSGLKKRIMREGRADMLALLKNANCDIIRSVDNRDLDKVVRKGHEATARWLAAHLKAPAISSRAIHIAASRGYLRTVAFAHDSGLGTCAPSHVAVSVLYGRLEIAKWATGDDLQCAPARPIDAWYKPFHAYRVAQKGYADVLEWMVSRSEMAPTITVGVARCAVASGRWQCALVLHRCGLVPVDAWDALTVAVRHCVVDGITALADAGARCSVDAMVAALLLPKPDTLAFLCGRFGIGDLQAAINSIIGLNFAHKTLAWVAANVSAVCVAQHAHQQWLDHSVPADQHFACACPRCRA
nr:hypothetical protein [Pandoravirus massiliensis]